MPYRRRVPRQPADWVGLCHIENESAARWRDCRIFDISMLGVGITFEYPSATELIGRRISVEVPAVGDSVRIRLEGEIKNASRIHEGSIRVGIEFVGLTEAERAITTVLSSMSGSKLRTKTANDPLRGLLRHRSALTPSQRQFAVSGRRCDVRAWLALVSCHRRGPVARDRRDPVFHIRFNLAATEWVSQYACVLKGSTQRLGERLRWCHPTQRLSRASVEGACDGIELLL